MDDRVEPHLGQDVMPDIAAEMPKDFGTFIYPNNLGLLQDLAERFRGAEMYLKKVELSENTGLNIPTVNELRYVGFHVLSAFRINATEAEQAEELKRAKRHCDRASYDALELGIINQLEQIRAFQERFKSVNVALIVADYPALLRDCQASNDFLAENQRNTEIRRVDLYVTHWQRLRQISHILHASYHAVEDLEKSNQLDRRSKRVGWLTAILGVFITLITTWLAIATYQLNVSAVDKDKKIEKLESELQRLTSPSQKATSPKI